MDTIKVLEQQAIITCNDVSPVNLGHIKKIVVSVFGIEDKRELDRIESELSYSGKAFITSGSFDMLEMKLKIAKYYFVSNKISSIAAEIIS